MDNYAAVLHGALDLRLEKRKIVTPGSGEAQVRVLATGCCGSDLHYYLHGKNGEYVVRDPMVLGHESAGIITAIGSDVVDFVIGDRVAIEAGAYCGICRHCKIGRYNLCANIRFCSSAKVYPHQDGTLQTAINYPVRFLHKLPDSCTYEQASLVEPLSVALHAARRSSISPGQNILVLGAGAVGILACSVASAHGATHIVISDINADRVNFAVNNGFAKFGHVLPMLPRPETPQLGLASSKKTSEEILKLYAPSGIDSDGFDVVLECTGVESCMQVAIHTARPGGKVVYIGMGTPNAMLPISAAAFREVDILGVFRYANTYPDALALFGAGKLPNVDKLVTTRFPLSKVNEAFECLKRGVDKDGKMVMKIMIGDY